MKIALEQIPGPGQNLIFREGDFLRIELKVKPEAKGKAYLRTNMFNPGKKRNEVIQRTEKNLPRRYQEWGDFPMERKDETTFTLELPLSSVGFFEAKTYLLPEDGTEPVWPQGDNLFIKVEPAGSVISNSIYSAFVRLFLEEKKIKKINQELQNQALVQESEFNVIPESGKFTDLIQRLDFIIDELGFDIIMLLPVHPVPTTYARMGLFGSPYASLDFFNIDPALAEFDKETTPLEQFGELVDAIHARHARIFMDIPANHTGWASQLQVHHPEYFIKNEEGKFVSPGAWGVTWSDLSELDYSQKGLWEYMAHVFLFWCDKRVDGFRCDAGYMIPAEAWKYITARVREEYPSTIFLLEGLGGKVSTTETLLTESNLNWAYSEMFQNFNQGQIDWYMEQFSKISIQKGPLINFSETHDNNRLAASSKAFSKLRNGLTALLSDTGTFAITCGVEWFADEKIDVHRLTSLRWGNQENQVGFIKLLNNILKIHPAYQAGSVFTKMHTSNCNSIAYLKTCPDQTNKLAVLANLSAEENAVYIRKDLAGDFLDNHTDLLSGMPVDLEDNKKDYRVELAPYQIIALSNRPDEIQRINDENINKLVKERKAERFLKHQIIKLFQNYYNKLSEDFIKQKVAEFKSDPYRFFDNHFAEKPAVVKWEYPVDAKRKVIIPRNTPLLLISPVFFRYRLHNKEKTMESGEGYFLKEKLFVSIIDPGHFYSDNPEYLLKFEAYENGHVKKENGPLLSASRNRLFFNKNEYTHAEIIADSSLSALSVNSQSGISLLRGAFSELQSKYDALISANLNPSYPDDRHIMLTRFRGWSVFKGFSRTLSVEYQKSFEHYQNTTEYYFEVPAGSGMLVPLTMTYRLDDTENKITVKIKRLNVKDIPTPPAAEKIRLVLRPDIESRNHHELTKAFAGPEKKWPANIKQSQKGFTFSDNKLQLIVQSSQGSFIREDEWSYMISRPVEKERGMDGDSDLFSPGYFEIFLEGNQEVKLEAQVVSDKKIKAEKAKSSAHSDIESLPDIQNVGKILKRSIRKFIVDRNSNKTVIAGYPWFLDWGRDTLICLRGIIAAGYQEEAERIITEFASFEQQGTLPNVIRGGDTSNRDTSDAPLWLFAAVKDLIEKYDDSILQKNCKGRKLRDVLKSIVENYMEGTPNGIKMDPASGLVFSPTHFTWMDTNYPAGTPREGYPIEIQALWYNALRLLTHTFPTEKRWKEHSSQVKKSIQEYYLIQYKNSTLHSSYWLSDCLHTNGYQPAHTATKDDHMRPNQLFAITFGAIDDPEISRGILAACEELLVPGAIRTLADRDTDYTLPVYRNNQLLNNPSHPYFGKYTGDEDTQRKPAYHNGTAWTWPFPSYCEALFILHGKEGSKKAGDILSTSLSLFNSGCINQIPEVLDGNFPHRQKGCYAQAWGITELYRVAELLGML